LLFQIKNLTRQDYGSTTEHHNPRQGASHDTSSDDSGKPASNDTVSNLKNRATKEQRLLWTRLFRQPYRFHKV
jgi:hypothetical protein